MKHRIFCLVLVWSLVATGTLVIAHEMTGWIAPEEAKRVKNPVKATKNCILCHGMKGDGKGSASAGLNPKPANFRESHIKKMTDGEHFWKITTGRGAMPSFKKDLTEEERWHVINYINTLRRKK